MSGHILSERALPSWVRHMPRAEGQFSVFWRQTDDVVLEYLFELRDGSVALMNVAGSMPGPPIDYEMEDTLHWIPPAVLIACGAEAMRRLGDSVAPEGATDILRGEK